MKTLQQPHYISSLFTFLALVKCLMIVNYLLRPRESVEWTEVTNQLETIYNTETEVFDILNKTEIAFLLRPEEDCRKIDFVLMVLSAPKNSKKRDVLRNQFGDRKEMKLIFLLGIPPNRETQSDLEAEHFSHGDLVQISVTDHYTILAYKTLAGFVWIRRYCGQARLVVKMDDDVVVDWVRLLTVLERKHGRVGEVRPSVECPSVLRNVKPFQHNNTQVETIMNKWAVTTNLTLYPDYCIGWLYVTSPAVGLALAEVSVTKKNDLVMTNDDNFVTGILRSHLAGVDAEQLEGGLMGMIWNNIFSHCPFLGFTKNVFFNSFVLRKGSDGVDYVNGGRFYVCTLFEYFVYYTESISPRATIITAPFWRYCARSKSKTTPGEAVTVLADQNKTKLRK